MFGPATDAWFSATFAAPTDVQTRGWEEISSGKHSLLVAPTGSGKTLAAFLWCLDRLIHTPRATDVPGVRVLYVSPLKALVHDIERNLQEPLAELSRIAEERGISSGAPRIGMRTGDTPASERRRMLKHPPSILVTTPESLYLLLGSQARETLTTVETVIVDEVHALAGTKRGAHLALSLERLSARCGRAPQRIGLSATARPLDRVARFLGGTRPVAIVDASSRPALDLEVVVPVKDMARPDDTEVEEAKSEGTGPEKGLWPAIYPRLLALIKEHRSTILFVNSRGLCEKLTQRLNDIEGEPLCLSHHGSLSHGERRRIEGELKAGRVRAIVATSSLELGIDMGAVDLVVLVESPGSVARGLQRVGRAGHGVGRISTARIFPKHRGDLLETAVVAQRMQEGAIEELAVLENPLDVLAQQIVSAVAVDEWDEKDLLALIRGAANYERLPESAYHSVLDMLSGLYPSHAFADLAPRIVWDRKTGALTARRGSKMLSLVSGGTIPDRGLYRVHLGDGGPRVGELDEEMVHETIPGQVITLGASSWRVEQITRDQVVVSPAPGEVGKLPFWRGDGPGRPVELGRELGAFVRELSAAKPEAAKKNLAARGLDKWAQENLLRYLSEQKEASGELPTDKTIVVERYRDELGDYRVCVLSPFGSAVHAPWALAAQAMLSAHHGFDVQTTWSDDGIILRLGHDDAPPDAALLVPDPEDLEELLMSQLASSALFAGRFRENAARALLMPRRRPGQRTPLWVQRLKAQELLAVAKNYPAFPIVIETYRGCLKDTFNLDALKQILRDIRSRAIRIHEAETRSPSPFAQSLAFEYVATFLYETDTPLAERRMQALSLDRSLLSQLLGEESLGELLDREVIADVRRELKGRATKHADALHLLLRRFGDMRDEELAERAAPATQDELLNAGRSHRVVVAGEQRTIASEDAGLYRDALGVSLPEDLPDAFLATVKDALAVLLLRYARGRGPFVTDDAVERYGLSREDATTALEGLAREGHLLGGTFDTDLDGAQWCEREVYARIKRRSLQRLRSEIAPVPRARLGTFLPAWHGLTQPKSGLSALREAIVQLEGLPLPMRDLEATILPARVKDFRPTMLDELGASGWLCWVGHGSMRDGRVALYRRDNVSSLFAARCPDDLSPLARTLKELLEQRGASFFSSLHEAADASLEDTYTAMYELTWAGVTTNDTLSPLRAPSLRGAGRGRTRAMLNAVSGRWSLTRELCHPPRSSTEQAHARVQTLLARHGILSRDSIQSEKLPGGFSALYEVLRAMEERGQVRRGLFLEGGTSAQFASAGAVDRLRAKDDAHALVLAAVDPANPFGAAAPWPQGESQPTPKRAAGAIVAIVSGVPTLYVPASSKQWLSFGSANLTVALGQVTDWAKRTRTRLRIEQLDGTRIRQHPAAETFKQAGFRSIPTGLEFEGHALRSNTMT